MIFLLAAILVYTNANSQQYQVKGNVRNEQGIALPFVYTGLMQQDSLPVAQALTDTLGHFSLQTKKATCRLIIKQFSKICLDTVLLVDKDIDLGIIIVQEVTELQGVTIASRKKVIEQQVDRLVFNVENATMPGGGTAMDALKSTPGVRVQQDNVSIVGKGEVLVMIDDRLQRLSAEDLASLLKTIPSDNIKSIEVITTPPAKYVASGNSGLINIRLKKARPNTWDATIGAAYTQKTYVGGNVNGLFNYNRNRLSLQASVNKGKQQLLTTTNSDIFYTRETWGQSVSDKSSSDVLSTTLGLDYQLSRRWATGFKYLGSFTDRDGQNQPFTTRTNTGTMQPAGYITTEVQANSKPTMHALNWHHQFTLDSLGKNITVDVDYFNYHKSDRRAYAGNELGADKGMLPGSYFAAVNSNMNKVQNYAAKLDVTLPYKWANVSLGGKASYTNTLNNLVVYDQHTGEPVLNTDQSNIFNYKEYNQALYFSAGKKLRDKWEAQLGLRAEATQTKGYSYNLQQTNTNQYLQFFPTAYVTYQAAENHQFSMQYSRRIRRPDFDYLNPFVIRNSPYFYSEGNPLLKPSYINNLEFSYIHQQKWVSNLYYSQVTDFGQELSILDPATNVTRQTPLNYANTYQLGLSTYYNWDKLSWWNSFTGFNMNYQHVQSKTGFIASTEGYNGYIYTNNDFTANAAKTLFFGLNYGLQLPGRYQIFHISTMHLLDVSVKVLFLKKQLSVTVSAEDLLNAQRPLISYYSNAIKTNVRSYGDTRGFRVALSYKLGKGNNKFKQRDFGNEEERSRAH